MQSSHRYLTFDDPTHISLDNCKSHLLCACALSQVALDVFNTECHPLEAPQSTSYGSGNMVKLKPFITTSGSLPAISPNVASPQGVRVPLF